MSLRPFKFDIDNTGLNPNNLVVAEPHVLQGTGKRFIVTDHGPFYTNGLRIVDRLTGQPLAPRTQYTAVQLEEEATLESGKEVCSIIIIDDNNVSADVDVTYQAYGGWMSYSVTAIIEMIEAINLDDRPIFWSEIVGVPDRYPPAPHAHPLSDIYGWHKMFPALNAIRDAILVSDQGVFDAIREAFSQEIDRVDATAVTIDTAAKAHYANHNNPHLVTIQQLQGLTAAQINTLIAGRLAIDGTAVNSLKLEGKTYAQTRAAIVASIQNSELINGLMNKANLGQNYVPTDQSLVLTQGGWKGFKAHETTYGRNITELGGLTVAQINTLIAGRLAIDGTAVNSLKLEGKSYAQTRTAIVDSIQNSELDNGLMNKANLGETFVGSDASLVLTTLGWKPFKAHETSYGRTITELGGYTIAQVNTLIAGRLAIDGTAVNSLKLEGRTYAQTRTAIVDSIQNSELDNGLMNKANLGENYLVTDPSLVLTQTGWKGFKAHETSYGRNITELGGYTVAQVNALIAGRLAIDGTAVNSAKLEGKTYAQTRAAIVTSIQNSELVNGLMPKANLGENYAVNPALVLTQTGWKALKTQETSYGRTIQEMDGYSTAQVLWLIGTCLPLNGTAINSSKLENNTVAQILASAYAQVGTMGKRNLHVGTVDPSPATGVVGDVYFKY